MQHLGVIVLPPQSGAGVHECWTFVMSEGFPIKTLNILLFECLNNHQHLCLVFIEQYGPDQTLLSGLEWSG